MELRGSMWGEWVKLSPGQVSPERFAPGYTKC